MNIYSIKKYSLNSTFQRAKGRLDTVNGWQFITYAILVSGLILRAVVWWQQRSIFLDEANLIRNYVDRTYGQLFHNLDYGQYAPPLFSVITKICIDLFRNNELSVRLFPLLCSMATLILFRRITHRWLSPPWSCLALAFVAFGAIFIDLATECKQYATDGFVAMGLLEIAHWAGQREFTMRLALFLTALGMTAVWLSMTAVFILAAIGLWWLTRSISANEHQTTIRLVFVGIGWAISFLGYFFLLLKSNAESAYLQSYHSEYFLAFPPASIDRLQLLGNQLQGLADRAIGKTVLAIILAGVGFIVGSWQLVKRRNELFWLGLIPIILCFITSSFHYYSIIPRLTLFFLPLAVLVVFCGLAALSAWRVSYLVLFTLAVVVLSNHQRLGNLFSPFHSDYGEVRDGLQYIAQQQRPGEIVFMNHNVAPIARYYLQYRNSPIHLRSVLLQEPRTSSSDIFQDAILQLHRRGRSKVWLLYDRSDELLSTFAATQGKVLKRHNFERGYVLLLEFY